MPRGLPAISAGPERPAPARPLAFRRVEIVVAALVLVVVAWFVTAPLREPRGTDTGEDPRLADLEARKEAKYREIRDAELDHEQGKLSDADWQAADAELRREAIEILAELDRAGPGE
jgi:hypothetical protein